MEQMREDKAQTIIPWTGAEVSGIRYMKEECCLSYFLNFLLSYLLTIYQSFLTSFVDYECHYFADACYCDCLNICESM